MKNTVFKIIILFLLPLIPMMGVTNAVLRDSETSYGSSFKASNLDMELTHQNGNLYTGLLLNKSKLKKDEVLQKNIYVKKSGNLAFHYYPEFVFINGTADVCEELELTVEKEGNEIYSGDLTDFDLSSQSAQITEDMDAWKFSLLHEIEDTDLQGQNCEFDIKFNSFQNADKSGFSDRESVRNNVGIAYEPKLTAQYKSATHSFVFTLSNIETFTGFTYEVTYDTSTVADGFTGSEVLDNDESKTVTKVLGTCSDGVCTYQSNPHDFDLTVTLTDNDGDTLVVTKTL